MVALGRYRAALLPMIALLLVLAALLFGMERYTTHQFQQIQAPYEGGAGSGAGQAGPASAVPGQANFTG